MSVWLCAFFFACVAKRKGVDLVRHAPRHTHTHGHVTVTGAYHRFTFPNFQCICQRRSEKRERPFTRIETNRKWKLRIELIYGRSCGCCCCCLCCPNPPLEFLAGIQVQGRAAFVGILCILCIFRGWSLRAALQFAFHISGGSCRCCYYCCCCCCCCCNTCCCCPQIMSIITRRLIDF